jgi:hypothetical protein
MHTRHMPSWEQSSCKGGRKTARGLENGAAGLSTPSFASGLDKKGRIAFAFYYLVSVCSKFSGKLCDICLKAWPGYGVAVK